jgi:hypothetical protein
MVDWVDEVPKFHGAVAATLQSHRQGNPGGGVGILAAVLADAWDVSFDVPRLQEAFVKRRIEQLDQFVSDSDGVGIKFSGGIVKFPSRSYRPKFTITAN